MRIRQAFIVADPLERTANALAEVLDLVVQFRDGDKWIQFVGDGVSLAIAAPSEAPGIPLGSVVPVLEVDNFESHLRAARAQRWDIGDIRDMGSHGRSVMLSMPEGGSVCLFQQASTSNNDHHR